MSSCHFCWWFLRISPGANNPKEFLLSILRIVHCLFYCCVCLVVAWVMHIAWAALRCPELHWSCCSYLEQVLWQCGMDKWKSQKAAALGTHSSTLSFIELLVELVTILTLNVGLPAGWSLLAFPPTSSCPDPQSLVVQGWPALPCQRPLLNQKNMNRLSLNIIKLMKPSIIHFLI